MVFFLDVRTCVIWLRTVILRSQCSNFKLFSLGPRARAKVFRNKFAGACARGPNEKKIKLFSGRSPTDKSFKKV